MFTTAKKFNCRHCHSCYMHVCVFIMNWWNLGSWMSCFPSLSSNKNAMNPDLQGSRVAGALVHLWGALKLSNWRVSIRAPYINLNPPCMAVRNVWKQLFQRREGGEKKKKRCMWSAPTEPKDWTRDLSHARQESVSCTPWSLLRLHNHHQQQCTWSLYSVFKYSSLGGTRIFK